MNIKWAGALLVLIGSGGVGILMASSIRKEWQLLQRLHGILLYISCELNYRQTLLPQIFAEVGEKESGILGLFFRNAAAELEKGTHSEAYFGVLAAMERTGEFPDSVKQILIALGRCIGTFDLEGQLLQLRGVLGQTEEKLADLKSHKEVRMRNCQTLGFCAGAVLAIMMI